MSHSVEISVPDLLYEKLAAYAKQQGEEVETAAEAALALGVGQLAIVQADAEAVYDPALDPLAPFIGAFAFEDDPGWMERHDEYFAGEGSTHAKSS